MRNIFCDVYIALLILIFKVFLEKYESILSFLRDRFAGYKVVIHGDFNINLLLEERNNLCSKYISLMYSCGLLPTIVRPTRISNTSYTLIDNIWINGNVESKFGIIMSNISDHYAIFNIFCRRVSSCSDSYVEISRRKLNAENREQLKSAIINYYFSSIMNLNSVETSYNMFAGILKTL